MSDICKFCGSSFSEIKQNGLVGCEHCYTEIDELNKSIKKMYNNKTHKGRGV